MALLQSWTASISNLLIAAHGVSGTLSTHGGMIGDAREVFIRDILKNFLPQNLVIGCGQIIDGQNNLSKQIDIIIYRNDFPIFRTLGHADVFVVEGVIAAIEIKSSLNIDQLKDALDNCKSVKSLQPALESNTLNAFTLELLKNHPTARGKTFHELPPDFRNFIASHFVPAAYIFGYTGYKSNLADLNNAFIEWNNENHLFFAPDVICTEGCVMLSTLLKPFCLYAPSKAVVISSKHANSLLFLVSHILHRISESIGHPVHQSTKTGLGIGWMYKLDDEFKTQNKWHDVAGTVERINENL